MAEKKSVKKDTALISYIFGIISIVMAFMLPLSGIVFGIIGLVQSNKEKNELSKKARKYNLLGIILSSVLLILSLVINYYFSAYSTNLFSGVQ